MEIGTDTLLLSSPRACTYARVGKWSLGLGHCELYNS